jgi:hypothetical protein
MINHNAMHAFVYVSVTLWQCCQVRDFIPRSQDFLKWLGFFLIFILKSQSRDFFLIFERGKFEV